MGDARGRWEATTLGVETTNLKATTRGSSPGLRLIERFTRTSRDAIAYQVTFVDPETWSAPWTAALDLRARPDGAGVFEYACHEGNHGMRCMLAASRLADDAAPAEPRGNAGQKYAAPSRPAIPYTSGEATVVSPAGVG